ncbi:serine/arginine-rich splicing factor 4-like, partial [Trifolium medium]|nr:serine/arginine-rich splicing factor 4-like [Trifolium medium]
DYGNGNTLEFDRYEPSRCYDKKNDKEDYSGGSPKVYSQENVGRAQIGEETSNCRNGSKFQQALRRKYNRSELDDGKDDKIDKRRRVEDDIKHVHGSWVNPQSNGDASLMSHQRDKWRVSDSQHD